MPKESKIIKDSFEYAGLTHHIEYREASSFEHLPADEIRQVYGICFIENKAVIVKYKDDKSNLPGGKVEENETWHDAFHREIDEEISAKVLNVQPIGYQYPLNSDKHRKYELRVVAEIEPNNEYTSDPAGTVIDYELVDIDELNDFIDYGVVGEHMVEQAKHTMNLD